MVAGREPATAVRRGVDPGAATIARRRAVMVTTIRRTRRITVQPLLNWDAVVDISLLNGSSGRSDLHPNAVPAATVSGRGITTKSDPAGQCI